MEISHNKTQSGVGKFARKFAHKFAEFCTKFYTQICTSYGHLTGHTYPLISGLLVSKHIRMVFY